MFRAYITETYKAGDVVHFPVVQECEGGATERWIEVPAAGTVTLRATFRQETKQLGLKAELPVANLGKPISASVFLFSTELPASEHCDPALLETVDWRGLPLEVSSEGKLAVIE